MSEDEWVEHAMTDDSVVVGLLLKLSQAPPPQPTTTKRVDAGAALRVEWSVRQRRSRQLTRKKGDTRTRASPTTPLSWSGATATSVSGGGGGAAADGFEESSLAAKPVDTARSKIAVARETPTVKRSRKRKTLSELKEEEILLLKERRNLRDELQTLQLNVDKQRAWNGSLKRLKIDLLSQQTPSSVMVSVKSEEVNFIQSQQIKVVCNPRCSTMPISAAFNEREPSPLNASTQNQIQEVEGGESSFLLPDLNLPVEDDSSSEVLYGMS